MNVFVICIDSILLITLHETTTIIIEKYIIKKKKNGLLKLKSFILKNTNQEIK